MTTHEKAIISERFDSDFYRLQVPDLGGADPLEHFVSTGWRAGYDPTREFSVRDYLAEYPDIAAAGCNPYYHFLTQGQKEQRFARPTRRTREGLDPAQAARARAERMVDRDFYLARNPDVAAAGLDPIVHFFEFGWRERRDPNATFSMQDYLARHPELGPDDNPLLHFAAREPDAADAGSWDDPRAAFDRDFYLKTYPDIAASGMDPFDHYMQHGWREGRDPSPRFSTSYYLGANADVVAAGLNPLEHFVLFGRAEGRAPTHSTPAAGPVSASAPQDPRAAFDRDFYLSKYPDIGASGMDPFEHYMQYGWREGRDPSPGFSTSYYLRANPDVVAADLNPLEHYVLFGWAEGRAPLPVWRSIEKTHGDILFVTHDVGVGGAQEALRSLGRWFQTSTKFGVKFLAIKGGAREYAFRNAFPLLNLAQLRGQSRDEIARAIKEFAGDNVRCVFVNSVASADFFDYWDGTVPIVSYLHELFNIIEMFGDNIQKVADRSSVVVGCSKRVCTALRFGYGIPEARLRLVYDFVDSQAGVAAPTPETRAKARRKFGVDADTYVVMASGVVHWRKSPDKFVEVAAQARRRTDRSLKFIWIGDGEDTDRCEALARQLGVDDIVTFAGYSTDVMNDLHAADTFVLTSEEDPFPLVCIEAALSGAPIICFERAGGMPEFCGRGGGTAVPFGDVPAMAAAVAHYANDESLRRSTGQRARDLAAAKHTVDYTGPQFLEIIRQVTGAKPHVSVIVPNYNYAEFLPARLESIYGQTFRDYEIILLDDGSTDGSQAMLEEAARERPLTRYIPNTRNSGSPFVQWLKGMDEAQGELVWIAEADDFCAPNLLETLVPRMQDRNVFFGYVHSTPVDVEGRVLGDYRPIYLNRIAEDRWSQSYTASDHEEIEASLAIANSVPNASAVVFRKFDAEPEFRDTVTSMRMCGDWYFYIRAIRGGKVAFAHQELNFHRRHGKTVTHQTEGSPRYFDELAQTRRLVSESYRISPETAAKAERFTIEDLDRFGVTDPERRNNVLEGARYGGDAKKLPAILVVTSDLGPGGGQMFSIRLANAWTAAGGRAVLLNAAAYPTHPNVAAMISPRVPLFHAGADEGNLADLVRRFDIDAVHSSIWWADRLVHDQIKGLNPRPKWVLSMHGCYETLLAHPEADISFGERLPDMLRTVDHWVYTADKNLAVFEKFGRPNSLSKVLNGFSSKAPKPVTREQFGLRPNALVACLISRAIESKGWRQAVAAVSQLNQEGLPVDLILCGEGPEADELKQATPPHVKLMGQVSNAEDYISVSDVALLPTYFIGESMPLILIEYMAQGKPVVATNVGEISSMLTGPEGPAGIIFELEFGTAPVSEIKSALLTLADAEKRQRLGERGKKQFEEYFSMDRMLAAYQKLYKN